MPRRATTTRRALGSAAALCALLLTASCGGGAAPSAEDSNSAEPAPTATAPVDPGAGTAAVEPTPAAAPGLDPAMAVDPPGPLSGRLESADLLVNAPATISDETVAAIKDIDGVAAVLQVELAQVPVEGKALNVLAVDPASYRRWTRVESAELQEVWDRVAAGEVAVPPDTDEQLLSEGDFLTLGVATDAPQIHVGAYAPQVPFIDAVVNRKWGERLAISPGNALIISTGITAPQVVQKKVQQALGEGPSVQALDVVAQIGLDPDAPQTAFLVGNVAEAVGTYRYTVAGGGRVVPDASWVETHIATETVPILGTVTCNTRIFPQLKAALAEVVQRGLADTINPGEYAGCYYPRFIAGSNRLSNHAFGLALDLNVPGNQRGTVGEMNRDVVAIFKKWGFAWGGDWGFTDPMHFEMAAIVNPGR
jgi:hypothetical protein